MELELGLKITHTRDDDLTSMADFRITKDPSGPVFVSQETETKFILIGHLKGFRRENIDIEINEDGSRIAISGKKPVQQMVLKGWIVQKKEVEIRAFRKVFRIPDGVILDNIKAKFNEEMSDLTIFMSKLVKGFCGFGIEEVKEEEMKTVADKEIRKESELPAKMEETDQVAGKERPVVAEEAALKEEIIEKKVAGNQDSGQVVEQANDRRVFEARKVMAEEFPERDDSKEAMKEKPEESWILKNATERVEESIQRESKEAQVTSREESDQVVQKPTERSEIERQASAEKIEASGMTEKFQETASLKPEEQAKRESIQTEETHIEKLVEETAPELGSEKHAPSPDIIKSTESGDDQVTKQSELESSTLTQVSKDYQVESEKQEPPTEIQELTKPEEPCHERESEETTGNEIEEEETGEENQPREKVDEHECHELEEQRALSETEGSQMKKNVSKKTKVCPPLVIAGSALLISLIVLVFQLIRSKKR